MFKKFRQNSNRQTNIKYETSSIYEKFGKQKKQQKLHINKVARIDLRNV